MSSFHRARLTVTLLVVVLALFVSAETAIPAHASPSISLNVDTGPVGTVVQVTGSGFDTGDTSCTPSPAALVTGVTPGNCGMSGGSLSFTFTVGSVAAGPYSVQVTGTPVNDVSAPITFTVESAAVSLSPTSGPVGTTVTITGSGFNTGDAGTYPCVTSTPSSIVTAATCTFSATGSVSGSFQVAVGSTAGAYTVAITGSTSDSASAAFTVTSTTATISVSPTSAPDGTGVTFTGSGFSPSDAGTYACVSSTPSSIVTAATCTFSASGSVSGSFKVKNTAAPGVYTIKVTGSPTGDAASAQFTVTAAAISLSPNFGPGGTVVSVTGSGFNPGDAGTYTCLSSTPASIVTAVSCSFTASGSMSGSFQVLSTAVLGDYSIKVTGSTTDSAFATFTVTSATPTITLDPASVSAGGTVTISGSGFKAGESCKSITTTPTDIVKSPTCHFTSGGVIKQPTDFIVKSTASPGTYTVIVTGSSGDSASALLTVVSQTGVVFTPAEAPVGATVGVTATDTGAPHPAGTCSIYGTPVSSVGCTETKSGAITGSFIVSSVAPGAYQVQVTGTSGAIMFGVFIVQGPFIQFSGLSVGQVASGPTGTTVTITGAFFPLSDTTCDISTTSSSDFIASGTESCSVFAGSGLFAGFNNVTGSFIVGNVNPGQYIVQVTTSPSGTFAQAVFNVISGAFIQLFPSTAATGSQVTIEGSDFLPTDTTCSLSSPTSGNVIVDGACSFFTATSGPFKGFMNVTGSFNVGNVAPGDYVIEVDGNQGDSAQAVLDVTSGPFIQLFPTSGPTGISVQVDGSRFLSTDTTCTLSSPTNGNAVVDGACSFFTPSSGTFAGLNNVTGSFIVGNVPPGQYVIEVDGNQGDFAQAIFNVATGPSITLSPASGKVGISVIVNGTNFLPTDTSCTITSPTSGSIILDGACAISAGTGKPEASFLVGSVPAGQYTIEIDGNQGDSAQALFSVTTGPTLTLSPGSGRIGTHVLVNGTGFLPTDTSCTITSPTSGFILVAACSIQAGSGIISGSFTVGNVPPGQYVVEVDGSPGADFAQAVFNVTVGAQITLSPGTARPGIAVIVNGTGFLPTDSSCTILSPGTSAVLTGSSACAIQLGTGVIQGSFIVGNVQPGQYVIQVQGDQADFAQAVLNVTGGPSITITPIAGTIGTTISVHGAGFLTTDQSCSISSTSTPNPVLAGSSACAITVGTGIVTGSFIIGDVPAGEYVIEITACSGNNGCAPSAGDFAQAVLTVSLGAATLTLFPSSAAEDTTVTLTGTGLSSSDTACSVESFSGATPDNTLITSSSCSVVTPGIAQGTFVVGPYATSDISWNVKVEGSPVDDLTPAAAFTVIPDVIVTPTSGTVNTVFTFTGSGFSSAATSCTAVTVPAFGTPSCAISGNTGQVSGSVVVPAGTIAGTYGLKVTDSTTKTATGVFTVGTPSALLVLNPASVGQGQPVGIAGFGFNPQDAYCVIYPQPPAFPIGPVPPGQATCQISGGYASGSFVVSPTAPGGYYLMTVIACSIAPTNDVCPAADTLDFASNFLGVTLATTITTYSTTTSTSSTTTSMSTTTTTVATSFSYSSTTYSTTGILYTTYTHQSLTTVSAPTTTTLTQTTSTTQTQTTVSLSTTTAYTTVPCGPLPCGFAIQPAPVNPAPSIDSAGLLAALLLVIPMLLRRLFG